MNVGVATQSRSRSTSIWNSIGRWTVLELEPIFNITVSITEWGNVINVVSTKLINLSLICR